MERANKKYPQSKLFPELNPALHFFTVAEVSIILGTSTRLVLEWVNQGLLRSFRVGEKGRLIRIRQRDLESFILIPIFAPANLACMMISPKAKWAGKCLSQKRREREIRR